MRLFEGLLLLIYAPVVVWPLLPLRRPRWLDWLPGTAVFLLLIHLLFEGYRWQMIPAYVLTGWLAVWTLARRGQETAPRRIVVIVGAVLGMIIFAVAVALPILLPVPNPLPPTGPYAVGATTLYLVDESRDEIFTPEADRRELMAQVWYPANPTPDAAPLPYLTNMDVVGPALAEQFDLPAFLFDHINLTQTDSYPDAPPVDEAFPVIIFSHGLTGLRVQNTTMAQELASHGYVVAALDHTYGNAVTVFPDGRIIFYDACRIFTDCRSNPQDGRFLVGQWAEDIAFLLDEMAGWNGDTANRFYGRFNLSQVGVFGHSTGGGAAVEFCHRDARCQAGLGLDAWVLPVSEAILTEPLTQPFMFIGTPRWLGPDNAARGQAIYEAVQNDAYNLSIAETGHFDFSDLPLFSPLTPQLGLSGAIDSARAATILNAYAVAFFDRYLKGEDAGILGGETAVYPEVNFARRTNP